MTDMPDFWEASETVKKIADRPADHRPIKKSRVLLVQLAFGMALPEFLQHVPCHGLQVE